GMQFKRHHMQTRRPVRVILPSLPQSQEIMPQAKPCFTNGKAIFASPAFNQIGAMDENTPGLFQGTPFRMIDIFKIRADGHATLIESRYCRNQWLIVAGHTFCVKKYEMPSRTMIRDRARPLLL